jgi:hypothetical protein
MDAGCEHTVLLVGGAGKFVVIAVGERWTAGCCFASRDASVVRACSRSAAVVITGIPTAAMAAASRRARRSSASYERRTKHRLRAARIIVIAIARCANVTASCANAQRRSRA